LTKIELEWINKLTNDGHYLLNKLRRVGVTYRKDKIRMLIDLPPKTVNKLKVLAEAAGTSVKQLMELIIIQYADNKLKD